MSGALRLRREGRIRRTVVVALSALLLGTVGSCMTSRVAAAEPPTPPPPTFDGAVASYYGGSFDASVETLKALLAANASDTRAQWELVRLYEEAGQYDKAVTLLRGLAAVNSDGAGEELFIALVLAGRTKEAQALETAEPENPASAKMLFYAALLALETGDDARASSLFTASIGRQEFQPMAWYFLGEIAVRAGHFPEASADFNKALEQNPNLTIALAPLARSVLAEGKYREAYPLLRRVRNILPHDAAVEAELLAVESEHPELKNARIDARTVREKTAQPPVMTSFPAVLTAATEIRVGLAEELKSVTIKTGGAYSIASADRSGGIAFRGSPDTLLVVTDDQGTITVARSGEAPFLSSDRPLELNYANPADTTIVFDVTTGRGDFFAATRDRAYRGVMLFRPESKGLTLINRLPLDEYLYSVLPSEMPPYWPKQALEAQAVAARSYTIASLGRFAKKGYDVAGSVLSAAYGGVGNETTASTDAVNATQGQILLFDGKPLLAFYSANTGGYTENSTSVWGEHAGMAAVPDALSPPRTSFLSLTELNKWIESDPAAYDARTPYYSRNAYRWQKWVPAAEIAQRAGESAAIGPVVSITSRGRGISGRINDVEITGTLGSVRVRGDKIRWVLGGLRSNLFTSRPMDGSDGMPEYFIFQGAGWGHGVGMDQTGAAGMASAGFDYTQILAHYYPRAELGVYLPDEVAAAR